MPHMNLNRSPVVAVNTDVYCKGTYINMDYIYTPSLTNY